jgi:hypothetical protein
VNQLLSEVLPKLGEIFKLLGKNGLEGFELVIPNHYGKLIYVGKLIQSPNETILTNQVKKVLDMHYPDKISFLDHSMMSSNYTVAQGIARVLSERYTRDRRDIESQLRALLAAFRSVE